MTFRTAITIPKSSFKIDHNQTLLSIGSCFAESMGKTMHDYKFAIEVNPFGILYNPLSIFKSIGYMLGNTVPENGYVESQDTWRHFDFHSELSATSKDRLNHIVHEKIHQLKKHIKNTEVIFLTFGTAYVHTLNSTREVVANCHKVPAAAFTKRLLNTHEIIRAFEPLYKKLPHIKWVITVSPIRHTKEGLSENSLSKSVLRVACNHLQTNFDNVTYFPGYEIMLDDLRDYRFYKEDMIHPNSTAEKYIWEQFAATYFSEETNQLIDTWQKLKKAISHKPFNTDTDSYRMFLEDTLKKLELFNQKIDIPEEIAIIKERLNAV